MEFVDTSIKNLSSYKAGDLAGLLAYRRKHGANLGRNGNSRTDLRGGGSNLDKRILETLDSCALAADPLTQTLVFLLQRVIEIPRLNRCRKREALRLPAIAWNIIASMTALIMVTSFGRVDGEPCTSPVLSIPKTGTWVSI